MIRPILPRRLYRDGDQWCAVGPGFSINYAGFGDTQAKAVANLNVARHEKVKIEDFKVGGFCRRCKEWVAEEDVMEGCRDPDCPCA